MSTYDLVQHSAGEFPIKEKGFSSIDYRVFSKEMKVVLTTKDEKKAIRIAEKIEGSVHASR